MGDNDKRKKTIKRATVDDILSGLYHNTVYHGYIYKLSMF